jgi:hypothetical protein
LTAGRLRERRRSSPRGADPNIRDDKYGAPALGWAHFFDREDFAKLLRERGGHK